MITPDYVRLMARYNAWQNRSLYGAADTLDDAACRQDRGAFFGSIHATLNHLLWADRMWMSRFAGTARPAETIATAVDMIADWETLKMARAEFDTIIEDWAAGIDPDWLAGDLTWFSGAVNREISKPTAFVVAHFFNHQTHHRGQVHAMLTAAGAMPGDTDVFLIDG
jgi:uncharacterized damage-inducible protein DinB